MNGRPWIAPVVLALASAAAEAKPPTLAHLYPAGATRGQSVAVAATGTLDHWPAGVWVEGVGIAVEAGPEKGKLAIRVAADAVPGVHWVRLSDEEGATELRPFVVGTLPEADENEPNDDPEHAQPIRLPSATVNGRLGKNGDVDGISVALLRGQTLVADLEANRHLGSPMDAVLQVASASGLVLAQNDDYAGRDPRIVFEAPADATYLVRVFAFPSKPDQSIRYAGGDAFIYRLTLTTGGFLDHAFPPATSRDVLETVALVGPNLAEGAGSWTPIPLDDGSEGARIVHPGLAGTADLRSVAGPVAIEAEPNDLAHPQAIPDRGTTCGRLDRPGDRDAFLLALKAGEKRIFRVEARSLGLPIDPALRVVDAAGKVLAEADDTREDRDPRLTFTAPGDGDYRVVVRDLHGRGGPRFAYILRVLGDAPDFALSLAADRFDATPGKPASVVVTIDRRDGFAGPIEVVAEGLPAGMSAAPATSRAEDGSAKAVTLTLAIDGCACPGPFRLVGREAGGERRSRPARFALPELDAKTDRPWLTIRPDAPKPSDAPKP